MSERAEYAQLAHRSVSLDGIRTPVDTDPGDDMV